MRFAHDVRVRQLNGNHLVIVRTNRPEDSFSLVVNESYAFLVRGALRMGEFSGSDLAAELVREYALGMEHAMKVASDIMELWKRDGLL